MCQIALISNSARINEPYKFSNSTIKSQRAITRIIARAHRNCVAACEMCPFRKPCGDQLDELRKLINIFGKLEYVFLLSIDRTYAYFLACMSSAFRILTLSYACVCVYILRVYVCVYVCTHVGVHVTWNKWRY